MIKFICGAVCVLALQAYGWQGLERLLTSATEVAQTGYHHLENVAANTKRGVK